MEQAGGVRADCCPCTAQIIIIVKVRECPEQSKYDYEYYGKQEYKLVQYD